jgi:uncharacterized protein
LYVQFNWDEAKAEINRLKHSVAFECVTEFEWDTAIAFEDARQEKGERRLVALGRIDRRLHVLIWMPRNDRVRVISLRKANRREERFYAQAQT